MPNAKHIILIAFPANFVKNWRLAGGLKRCHKSRYLSSLKMTHIMWRRIANNFVHFFWQEVNYYIYYYYYFLCRVSNHNMHLIEWFYSGQWDETLYGMRMKVNSINKVIYITHQLNTFFTCYTRYLENKRKKYSRLFINMAPMGEVIAIVCFLPWLQKIVLLRSVV